MAALDAGADNLSVFAASDRTRLSAMAHVADRSDRHAPAFITDNPLQVGPTVDALAALDYPVYTRVELLRQPEHARRTADGTLWDALGGADTTRATPARTSASAHGGDLPKCEQGSSVT